MPSKGTDNILYLAVSWKRLPEPPEVTARTCKDLRKQNPLDFGVLENVVGDMPWLIFGGFLLHEEQSWLPLSQRFGSGVPHAGK